MNEDSSKAIRSYGDETAFSHWSWEHQSREWYFSSKFLVDSHLESLKDKDSSKAIFLPVSQFGISMAIELIAKAYFLRSGTGNREDIYRHDVLSLCKGISFDDIQRKLMSFAESTVVWAGRYPTPKWTKEVFKEEYDVKCTVKNGVEHLESDFIKTCYSPQRINELQILYNVIHDEWIALGK